MENRDHFAVIAIPLSRPEIVEFLLTRTSEPRGAKLKILAQRPTHKADALWVKRLTEIDDPTIVDLLAIENPCNYLVTTTTDRLVPVESLQQPNFLTRDLGGWVANYFGVAKLKKQPWPDDPLLNNLELLTDYGSSIDYLGADADLVKQHLATEMGGDVATVIAALARLHTLRQENRKRPLPYIDQIYAELASENCLATAVAPPIPVLLLYEELLDQMVRLEQRRRSALANGQQHVAAEILTWQRAHEDQSGLRLILQSEYIVGRHRRSSVLIAPELDIVIKQPAPEPLHDIALRARYLQGRNENWPVTVNGGALVMPHGRIQMIFKEGIIPRLSAVFNHPICFSLLLGLTIEQYVTGKTVQDWVLEDHSRLTPELYENIVLHQQVCEVLEIDNNDWHAPNFVRRDIDGEIIHIDWGAARPLETNEHSPKDKLVRLNQVSNMAFSFKDEDLALCLKTYHQELINDEARMAGLHYRALDLVECA